MEAVKQGGRKPRHVNTDAGPQVDRFTPFVKDAHFALNLQLSLLTATFTLPAKDYDGDLLANSRRPMP